MHRYSWGSGHSHSSSTSLHSSATLGLGSSGKDDLWAAIQTNYNYIMDTNLLDTCKEARFEIEEAQPSSREAKFQGNQMHVSRSGVERQLVCGSCNMWQRASVAYFCANRLHLAKTHTMR